MNASSYLFLAIVAPNEWTDPFFRSGGIIHTEVFNGYAFLFYMEETLPEYLYKGRLNRDWRITGERSLRPDEYILFRGSGDHEMDYFMEQN
jgi:hypothetical protein